MKHQLLFCFPRFLPAPIRLPPQLKIEKRINETSKTVSSETPSYTNSPKGWRKRSMEEKVWLGVVHLLISWKHGFFSWTQLTLLHYWQEGHELGPLNPTNRIRIKCEQTLVLESPLFFLWVSIDLSFYIQQTILIAMFVFLVLPGLNGQL